MSYEATDDYLKTSRKFCRYVTFFKLLEIIITAILLAVLGIMLFPVLLCLILTQGRPIFYTGQRIGIDGEPFTIYKLRTMKKDAEQKLHGIVCTNVECITPVGRFLRICRLDEIPQLWNIINGTMTWFGPRPMRYSVYIQNLKKINNYHKRLWVKPGLFGPTQVYLPHNTDKRIRFLFYCMSFFGKHPWTLVRKCKLVVSTATVLLLKSIRLSMVAARTFIRTGAFFDRRKGARVSPKHVACLHAKNGVWPIVEVDEFCLGLVCDGVDIPDVGSIEVIVQKKGRVLHRRAKCTLRKIKQTSHKKNNESLIIVRYETVNSNAQFFVDRYLLGKTIL